MREILWTWHQDMQAVDFMNTTRNSLQMLLSADAAAHLRYNNTKVDWSIRNNTLFCNIFANTRPNACNVCGSTFHVTGFCGQSVSAQTNIHVNQKQTEPDTYGRERINYLGREICNNFNGARGCMSPKCRNFHVCLLCKGEHSRMSCSQAKKRDCGPLKKLGPSIRGNE